MVLTACRLGTTSLGRSSRTNGAIRACRPDYPVSHPDSPGFCGLGWVGGVAADGGSLCVGGTADWARGVGVLWMRIGLRVWGRCGCGGVRGVGARTAWGHDSATVVCRGGPWSDSMRG